MKAMLHGYRRVDMVNELGQRVLGFSCFIGYQSEGVFGQETVKQWISDDLAKQCGWRPEPGVSIVLDFTPRGRVCFVANEKA